MDGRMSSVPLDRRSRDLRLTVVRMLDAARRGHLGSAFSLVEVLRVLYDDVLRYDPQEPRWSGRDRCILSKGHGCLALYALLADKGFFPRSELWKFCNYSDVELAAREISERPPTGWWERAAPRQR